MGVGVGGLARRPSLPPLQQVTEMAKMRYDDIVKWGPGQGRGGGMSAMELASELQEKCRDLYPLRWGSGYPGPGSRRENRKENKEQRRGTLRRGQCECFT